MNTIAGKLQFIFETLERLGHDVNKYMEVIYKYEEDINSGTTERIVAEIDYIKKIETTKFSQWTHEAMMKKLFEQGYKNFDLNLKHVVGTNSRNLNEIRGKIDQELKAQASLKKKEDKLQKWNKQVEEEAKPQPKKKEAAPEQVPEKVVAPK